MRNTSASTFVFTVIVTALATTVLSCSRVNRCLDSGGCWDSVDQVCRKEEPNAQELCNRQPETD